MDEFKVFSDGDVKQKISMDKAIELMRDAFIQISNKTASVPLRSTLESDKGRVLFMPSYSPAFNTFGIKVVSVFPDNAKHNQPVIQGKVLLVDGSTGSPKGLIDAEFLTALRTGAASGLATDMLANKNASVLAIFGTGAQAETQVEAILAVRPIKLLLVFGNSKEKAEQFCTKMSATLEIDCRVASLDRLTEADVICTATTSMTPLFEINHVKPGAHINGIGSYRPDMRELPGELIRNCMLVVDSRESALSEAGDILIPLHEKMISRDHLYAELGELVDGKKEGRQDSRQITVFKSVGNALQDLALASFLLS